MPILIKPFQKTEKEETLPNSFYKAIITLIPKPDKDTSKKRKLEASVSDKYTYRNPQQDISKPHSMIYKKNHIPWTNGIYYKNAKMVQYAQISQYNTPH